MEGFSIQESTHTIKISSAIAYNMVFDTYYALKYACENHWVSYPDSFPVTEKERLERMKTLFELANYADQGVRLENELKDFVDKIQALKKADLSMHPHDN